MALPVGLDRERTLMTTTLRVRPLPTSLAGLAESVLPRIGLSVQPAKPVERWLGDGEAVREETAEEVEENE